MPPICGGPPIRLAGYPRLRLDGFPPRPSYGPTRLRWAIFQARFGSAEG